MEDHRAILSLGANQGDVRAAMRRAVRLLGALSPRPPVCSSLWTTTPVDCPEGSPPFANAALLLRLPRPADPLELLERFQEIERLMGRRPSRLPNQPRPMDIDLISFDGLVLRTPELTLPHPRAHLRRFVLAPLAEIAPGEELPGTSRTVREWLALCPPDPLARRLPGFGRPLDP